MPDLSKMLKINGGKPMPHVGNMVYKVMLEKHVSKAELARRLDIHQIGLNRYLEQATMHVGLLWKIGLLLQHNFFDALNKEFPVTVVDEKNEQEKQGLQQQIIDLKKENELYQKVLKIQSGQ